MAIRVVLADDHAIVRDGLRSLLETRGDIKVVGDAADGRQAVREALRLRPDIMVMDIAMPGLNGIDATQQIHDACPEVKVIILSMYASREHILRAVRCGAKGYLLKEAAGAELVDAIKAVHADRSYLSAGISNAIMEELAEGLTSLKRKDPLDALSNREREVLQLVAEGKTSLQIGQILHLSPKTVDTYRSRLMHKLEIRSLTDLIRLAIRHGLIPEE